MSTAQNHIIIKPPEKGGRRVQRSLYRNDSFSLWENPEHTLKAPRPYCYNRGYIHCKLFCAADNLTMLYPNTAV